MIFLLAWVAINAAVAIANLIVQADVWAHLDVWAPVINTLLGLYLLHRERRARQERDAIKQTAREATGHLLELAKEPEQGASPHDR